MYLQIQSEFTATGIQYYKTHMGIHTASELYLVGYNLPGAASQCATQYPSFGMHCCIYVAKDVSSMPAP